MTLPIALVGEEVLRTSAKQVSNFTDVELIDFVEQLKHTMLEANGIGIAATQVFDSRAIMIVASRANPRYPDAPDMKPLVIINPKIISHSEQQVLAWEGCLSVPALRGNIKRYDQIDFEYQDITGVKHQASWSGFLARIFQHEYDHLIGKTWLDRIESAQDITAESVYFKSHP
jgi:peptide deformylase